MKRMQAMVKAARGAATVYVDVLDSISPTATLLQLI